MIVISRDRVIKSICIGTKRDCKCHRYINVHCDKAIFLRAPLRYPRLKKEKAVPASVTANLSIERGNDRNLDRSEVSRK